MILTAIVPGNDGKIFTLDSQREQLSLMFESELNRRESSFEVYDIDDIVVVQREKTKLYYRGKELEPNARVYAPTPFSICPARERKLWNIYNILLEQKLPVLNRSFLATPELEVNKTIMQAMALELGIPCVTSMDLPPHQEPEQVLEMLLSMDFCFPIILKPNRLSNGVGIIKCEGAPDFIEKVRLVQRLKSDYIIQEFVTHSGDLRVFMSENKILGHKFKNPKAGDFRCGGPNYSQIDIPQEVEDWCFRIVKHCQADYVTLDWMATESGYVFHEMCSTLGAFIGVSEKSKRRIAEAIIDLALNKLYQTNVV